MNNDTTTPPTDEGLPRHVSSQILDAMDVLSQATNYVELILMAHSSGHTSNRAVAAVANGAVSKLENVQDRLGALVRGETQ